MLSFAGWSVIGNLGFSFKDQGSNIILNLFYGTSVNAARGIAMQVCGLVSTFSSNFSMALNPQITKQYAAGHISECLTLVCSGARYTFYLLALVSIPFLINMDYVLKLWLGNVPEYTSVFLALSMIVSMLYTMTGTVTTALQATGKVKVFQTGICLIMLLELPAAYILLFWGCPPYYALYPGILTSLVAVVFRIFLLKRYVSQCKMRQYLVSVLLRCMTIFIVVWTFCKYVHGFFPDTFLTVVVTSVFSVMTLVLVIFFWGLSEGERIAVRQKMDTLLQNKRC